MEVEGGKNIESVIIPNADRLTLCVSVGSWLVPWDARFSTSPLDGSHAPASRLRNCRPVFKRCRKVLTDGRRITNIVFMGMGEPLDNPTNVMRAVKILHQQHGRAFALRKVTISTSDTLAPQIDLVAEVGSAFSGQFKCNH